MVDYSKWEGVGEEEDKPEAVLQSRLDNHKQSLSLIGTWLRECTGSDDEQCASALRFIASQHVARGVGAACLATWSEHRVDDV
eukprot:5002313-Pleurochrysis_carterae.AAC.2